MQVRILPSQLLARVSDRLGTRLQPSLRVFDSPRVLQMRSWSNGMISPCHGEGASSILAGRSTRV